MLHPGYDRLIRPVDVPAGARQPLALTLAPSQVVDWTAQILVEGLDQPLAGAVLRLTPVAVDATLAGPITLVSDWNGQLSAADVAVGHYDIDISAPGFEPVRREIRIEAGQIEAKPLWFAPAVDAGQGSGSGPG
ncbi:MAG: carboxypeptidase-like regulatory domain-containing protein [Chromatiales bacterium]|nr:carboxypeptidase-like regulatory domain-containing protein [Chromatiales bacterium]